MPYTTDQIRQMITDEATRQGVPPRIALAIAMQESGLNPNAVGDNGRSIGLFQLQPAATIDAGGRPEERREVPANIRYGVTYFKQQLAREGGHVERALSRYNRGTPTYQGIGDPRYVENVLGQMGRQPERPPLLARVSRALSPASAEAATLTRDEALFQALGVPEKAAATAPQGAPAAARDDELWRALGVAERQGPAPQAPAAPAPPSSAPAPAYDVDVQALGPPGTYQGPREPAPAPGPSSGPIPPAPVSFWQHPLQYARESLTGPIPAEYYTPKPAPDLLGQAGAMAIPTITTAIGTGVGGVPGGLVGAYVGRRINVGLGLEPEGPVAKVGGVDVPVGDVLSVAVPAVPALWGGVKAVARGVTKWSRAGEAIQQADEAARTAQQTYREGVQTAEQQTAAQRATAVTQQQQREAQYQQRLQQQQARAASAHQTREAQQAAQVTERQASAAQEAAAKTQQQAREYAEQVQRYEQAVASQQQAVGQARAIPPRYSPETPAHVLYKKVADIAPEAPVTLTRTQEVAAELQDVLQQVPALQPSRLQALLTDMRAARSTQSVREVQRYLTDLGTLTRSSDSATRRTAKQLYGALHDDLAESAQRLPATEAARDLLLQANATFRRELAARDLSGVVRRAITVGDDGIPRLAPGRLLTQFDRLVEGDRFFAGSFTPDELAQLRGELAGLTTAQKIPTRPGAAPPPVTPRPVEPFTPTPMQPPAPPARRAPYTAWKPDVPGPAPPPPVVPTLTQREQGAFRQFLRGVGMTEAVLTGGLAPLSRVALAAEAKDKLADALAQMMLTPRWQPYVRSVMQADGTVNLHALIALAGGRAALQREERGTATPQEAQQAVGTLRARYTP